MGKKKTTRRKVAPAPTVQAAIAAAAAAAAAAEAAATAATAATAAAAAVVAAMATVTATATTTAIGAVSAVATPTALVDAIATSAKKKREQWKSNFVVKKVTTSKGTNITYVTRKKPIAAAPEPA